MPHYTESRVCLLHFVVSSCQPISGRDRFIGDWTLGAWSLIRLVASAATMTTPSMKNYTFNENALNSVFPPEFFITANIM
jgi:hypothetical protein